LEFFLKFLQIPKDHSNVIPLTVSEVRPRKLIYLVSLSLGVTPSESDVLHLHATYVETPRQITICNDDNKFVAYPRSILQKFAVNYEVMVTIRF